MTVQALVGEQCLEGREDSYVMKLERQLELDYHWAIGWRAAEREFSEPDDLGSNSDFVFYQLFELEIRT